jgi:uncharacterized protein YbjT (DUF2867 family)
MTAVGITARAEYYAWNRRSERLVRASGNPYTIARPGWFDYSHNNQLQITLLRATPATPETPPTVLSAQSSPPLFPCSGAWTVIPAAASTGSGTNKIFL